MSNSTRPSLDQIFAQPAPTPAARPSLDQIFAQAPREKASPEASVSLLESGLRGAVQSGSLGFADEISGALESTFTDKSYEQARDESRANFKAAQEANPVTYGAGQVAGGVASAFVPGLNVAKLGTAGARVLGGAGIGALTGVGSSEASDVGGLASDAAVGGLIGGAASGIAESISPVRRYLQDKMARSAEELAVKSLKPTAAQIRKLGPEGMHRTGRGLLDEGLIKPGSNAESSLSRIAPYKEAAKSELVDVLNQADAALPSDAVSERVLSEVMPDAVTTGGQPAVSAVEKAVNDIGLTEARSLSDLNLLASNISSKAYGAPTVQAENLAKKSVERSIDRQIKEAVPSELLPAFEEANARFALGTTAEKLAKTGASRYAANQGLSLGDKGTGIAGYALMGPKGLLLGAANKMGRERGQSAAAVGLDKLSKLLESAPEAFGQYGPMLKQAAERGSNSLAVQHYLLAQRDSEYRKKIDALSK